MRSRWSFMVLAAALGLAATLTAGCLTTEDERARQDEQVGIAQSDGVTVRVAQGLAAVRHLQPGKMVLWAQSPILEIEMTLADSAEEDWTITVENCLADTELRAATAAGQSLVVTSTEEEHRCPTHLAWNVHLPRGQAAKLAIAPPDAQDEAVWSFGVINDSHGGDTLRGMAALLNANERLRMVVSSGDIAGSSDRVDLLDFQLALQKLRIPFYSTVGNNDVGSGSSSAWHEVFGRHSFHFAYRGVAFTMIDSASASVDPLVYDWLDGWLVSSAGMPHVALTHIPPLDPLGSRNAGFRSRSEAAKLLARLGRGGVGLLLCGHLHNYSSGREGGIPTIITGGRQQYDTSGQVTYDVVEVDPAGGTLSTSRVWAGPGATD